jgi:hypothetical protein
VAAQSTDDLGLGGGGDVQVAPVARQTPSLLMLGSTAGILVAFLTALIVLVHERRLLRRQADDYDDVYWADYR